MKTRVNVQTKSGAQLRCWCVGAFFFVTTTSCVGIETDSIGQQTSAISKTQRIAELRAVLASENITGIPAAPSVSDEMFVLGQSLAFDKILSGNKNISCMSCHHPDTGSGDLRSLPLGEGGTGLGQARTGGHIIPRNAPGLFNLHVFDTMFWDSRVQVVNGSLSTPAGAQLTPAMEAVFDFGVVSAQAMFPVTSREEMRGLSGVAGNEIGALGNSDFAGIWAALMTRLGAVPEYVAMFEAAYPGTPFGEMTFAHAANAIAGFEIRGFEFRSSPWEEFVAGDDSALSLAQLKGAQEFFDNDCATCHSGNAFSDFSHQNIGLVQFGPGKGAGTNGTDDFGREGVTGLASDRYRFRVPPLSNVELTGPWGHAGQIADLKDFGGHYQNPEQSLSSYKMSQNISEPALFPLEQDNRSEIAANISAGVLSINPNAVQLEDFMVSLTDDDARTLQGLVPATVPSGLPVAD